MAAGGRHAYSDEVLAYFASRAIEPDVAASLGVAERPGELVYTYRAADGEPFQRVRSLSGEGPKVKQPKGHPLVPWAPAGDRGVPVLVEGESDALAALSALSRTPEGALLRRLPVIAAPGTGCPVQRMVEAVRACDARQAVLAFDADQAGRKYGEKLAAALREANVRPIPLELPDGLDLAEWLAGIPEGERGQRFANALGDADAEASALAEHSDTAGVKRRARQLRLTRASAIVAEPVRWLLLHRIPLGAVTLFAGAPKVAKSTYATEVAARTSRGELDGALHGAPADVVILSYEDHRARTIRPRLEAAGADLDRVHILDAYNADGELDLVSLPDDVERLRAELDRCGARLLIVDPLVASLDVQTDAHKDQHVRRVLAPLARAAEELDTAIVTIAHVNKARDSDLLRRIGGSIGLAGAARSLLLMAPDPEDPEGADGSRRILAQRGNLGPVVPSLRLRVESRWIDAGGESIETSRVVTDGESDLGADELLVSRSDDDEQVDAITRAQDFLRAKLADGPMPIKELESEARREGIGWRTVERAKQGLAESYRPEGERYRWSMQLVESAKDVGGDDLADSTVPPNPASESDRLAASESRPPNVNVGGDDPFTSADQERAERLLAEIEWDFDLQIGELGLEEVDPSEELPEPVAVWDYTR